jgi:hypothetical protein
MNAAIRSSAVIIIVAAFALSAFLFPDPALGKSSPRYGEQYCDLVQYGCTTIQYQIVEKTVTRGRRKKTIKVIQKKVSPQWEELWPDETEREIVKRLNRMNGKLKGGMVIAYPLDMAGKTYMDYAPFPLTREGGGEKLIVVDLGRLAFAAYDEYGKLRKWGPIAGGRSGLRTPPGEYLIKSKRGGGYRSGKYPKGCGEEVGGVCSPMPFAMHFRTGYALHGGYLPGRHASHGCVRMYWQDAKWLNREFAPIGTRVLINWYPEGKPWVFTPPEGPAAPEPIQAEMAAEPAALSEPAGRFLHGLICELLAALNLKRCDHEVMEDGMEASLRPLIRSIMGPVGEALADGNPGPSLARSSALGLQRFLSGGGLAPHGSAGVMTP